MASTITKDEFSISRTLLCEVQEEVLTGILTFLVGERGGGGEEGHPSAKRALGRSHLPVNTKSK